MSEMLDRIRDELQQRLEATRAAAQEHERVRAALEALEKATRQVTGQASRRSRGLAARARPAGGSDRSAPAGAETKASARASRASAPKRTTRSQKPAARSRPPRDTGPAPSTPTTATGASRARTRSGSTAKPSRARAPQGANRSAVLAVVRERPGVTASELAGASGVTGGTLYALLRRLTASGELEKRELPGGQTGYAVSAANRPAAAAAASQGAPADSGLDASRADASKAKPSADGSGAPARRSRGPARRRLHRQSHSSERDPWRVAGLRPALRWANAPGEK
jgi:hypothetical protein